LDIFRCSGCGLFTRIDVEGPSVHGCALCGAAVPAEGAPQPASPGALRGAIHAAPVPLLVEFWAPDCEPCLGCAVVIDAVAHRLAGDAVVLRVDVDQHPNACEAYGILAVPTLVLFTGGAERGRRVGPVPAREIEAWVSGLSGTDAASARSC
jgi:thioredoxin 2